MLLVLSLIAGLVNAAVPSVELVDALIAKDVVARQPVEPSESFPVDVGSVVCWTKVIAKEVPTVITHVWYWEGKEVMRSPLAVKTAKWRTWSRKTIPARVGTWRVDLLDASGFLLRSLEFSITEKTSDTEQPQ